MPSKCQKHEHLFCELVAMQASEKSANQIASGFWRCLQASRQSKTVQRRLPIPTMKRRIPIVPNGFPKQWYKMTVYRFQLPIDSFIPDVKNEQTLISCVRKQARPCSTMVVSTTRFVQIMLTFPGCYVVILLRLSLHISSKVTDHARMNLLTNMGLMVAFQMATISVLGCIAFKAPSQIQSSSHYCIVA